MPKIKTIKQTLFITPTTQRANEIQKKYNKNYNFLKVITLNNLINELFEIYDSNKLLLDKNIALHIIASLISKSSNDYFKYLSNSKGSLEINETIETIYEFFIKLQTNDISIESFNYPTTKQDALIGLYKSYQDYKSSHNLVDKSDILDMALNMALINISDYLSKYDEVYVDEFEIENIKLTGSKKEQQLLNKILQNSSKKVDKKQKTADTNLYQNFAFNSYDEVRTAIKIAKKLLLDDNTLTQEDIVIISSDFAEYSVYYKILSDEYGMKLYDTIGVPLNSFDKSNNDYLVRKAILDYKEKVKRDISTLKYLGIKYNKEILEQKILSNSFVRTKAEGILFSEANKLIGLENGYKHIIFIGSDITHFPPTQSKNFLYTDKESIEKFNTNNIYDASVTLYNELKRLSDNLYIVTATYKSKRKLSQSIIIDKNIDNEFDISDIQSRNDLLKSDNNRIVEDGLQKYQNSISSSAFTSFDGDIDAEFPQGKKLSASALNTYEKCPMQYYFSSVLKLNAPEDSQDGFDIAGRGTLMHECFEYFVKAAKKDSNDFLNKPKKELYDIMLNCSNQAYKSNAIQKIIGDKEENIYHKIDLAVLQNGLEDIQSQNKSELAKFVDYFIKNKFEGFKNSNPEELFMLDSEFNVIDLDNKTPNEIEQISKNNRFIKGFIDRLDNLEDGVNIIDYKSSVGSKNIKDFKSESLKDYQLGIYMLYATQKYPNKNNYSAHLLSFKEKDKPSSQDYNTSISIPYNNRGTIIEFDNEYIKTIKQQINKISANISNGKFTFDNRDEKTCEYCNYKHICHQAVLDKEIKDEQ